VSRRNSSGGWICCRVCTCGSACTCGCACGCASACGARTRACRVHTRVNALTPFRMSTRPRIILRPSNQLGLHRIPLDVGGNPVPLQIIPNPMIVGFSLPKLLTRAVQQPVGFPRRDALQSLEQQARRDPRQQEHVDVIRHDDKRSKPILAHSITAKQRFDYQRGDCLVLQVQGARVSPIEKSIHPCKSFAPGNLARRRKVGSRQTSIQVPGEEQPRIVGIDVRKAALGRHALNSGTSGYKISRSHECERGTQECVRHNLGQNLGHKLGQSTIEALSAFIRVHPRLNIQGPA